MHAKRSATAVLTLLLAGLLVAITPVTGSAQSRLPAELPRGTDSSVAYLVGTTIHADGTTTPLPDAMLVDRGTYTLLGLSSSGWVVERTSFVSGELGGHHDIFVVSGTSANLIIASPYINFPDFRLSHDGHELLGWRLYDEGAYVTMYDLSGDVLGTTVLSRFFRPLDFDSSRVLFRAQHTTRLWQVGPDTTRRVAAAIGVFGDLPSGDLMLDPQRRDQTHDWTSLEHPAKTIWRARVTPTALNKTNNRVAGRAIRPDRGTLLQLRRVADGKVLQSFQPSTLARDLDGFRIGSVTWETRDAVIVVADTGDGQYLARCSVNGKCEQASPLYPGGLALAEIQTSVG